MEQRNQGREELKQRLARFGRMQPMSTSKYLSDIPHDADVINFGRPRMPVILEKSKIPLVILLPTIAEPAAQ